MWGTGGLAVQADGKIIVGGAVSPSVDAMMFGATAELTVLRFNANGTADTSFGTAGRAETDYGSFLYASGNDVALLSDGRVVVGGGNTFGNGLLAWFSPTGCTEQEQPDGDGCRVSDRSQPQKVLGGCSSDQYHGVDRFPPPVREPVRYKLASSALLGTDGKVTVVGPVAESFVPGGGGSGLAIVRFGDPGTTHSPTTFVQSPTLPNPAPGPVVLAAAVVPLLGTGAPFTEGTIVFREGMTIIGTLDLAAETAPGGIGSYAITVNLPAGDHHRAYSEQPTGHSSTTFPNDRRWSRTPTAVPTPPGLG